MSCVLVSLAMATASLAPDVARANAPASEESDRHARGATIAEEGTAKFDLGDYEGAIAAFKAAFDLTGDPLLLYNLGVCYDRLDQYDGAIEHFTRYRAVAPASEHEQIDRKIASAKARQEAASKPAATDSSTTATTPVEQPAGQQPPPPDSRNDGQRPKKVMGPGAWVLIGTSVAALGAGAGLGVVASRRHRSGDDSCVEIPDGRLCDGSGADDLDSGRRLGIGSIAAFAVGGALAIAAVAVISVKASRRGRGGGSQARLVPSALGLGARF